MPRHCTFFVLANALLLFFCKLTAGMALADGLVGDEMVKIVPRAGTSVEEAHRNVKQAFPSYMFSYGNNSKSGDEVSLQINEPVLLQFITRTKDEALNNNVEKIPYEIRKNLAGFIPKNLLDTVRWRVKSGGDMPLRGSDLHYGEPRALTVDHVVLFESEYDALYNPVLWVHELAHVKQFQELGIPGFVKKYLGTHGALEKEAYEEETKYVAWAAVHIAGSGPSSASASSSFLRPVESFALVENSKSCGTFAGVFALQTSAPVGTPCWAATPRGTVFGSLIPDLPEQAPPPPPVQVSDPEGFPPGYRMQECGCWGVTPSRVMPESRCASGNVRIDICAGLCAAGYPRYGYVCQ